MDNGTLAPLLQDRPDRFWLKPVGLPNRAPNLRAVFTQPRLRTEFAQEPRAIRVGDIFVVYRIRVSKLTFVAECLTAPRLVRPEELESEPWRQRWPWMVELANLTPEYGQVWNQYNLRPFTLARAYEELRPDDAQVLGALQFGKDKLRISQSFATFLIQRIQQLPSASSQGGAI